MVDWISTGKFSYEICWDYDDGTCFFEEYNSFNDAYIDFCKPLAEGCLGATLARLAEKYNIKKDDYWDFPKLVLTK